MDADYTDDLALLTNRFVQAKCLLHSHEQAVRSIGLYMNSNETGDEQDNGISSLNGKPLKLIDQFIYLGSNISFIEGNMNIYSVA